MSKEQVKVVVTYENSDTFFCIINCTEEQRKSGDIYDRAVEEGKTCGYFANPKRAFIEFDYPHNLYRPSVWDTAKVIDFDE